MLMDVVPVTRLGVPAFDARLRFGEGPKAAPWTWAGSRHLWTDGSDEPAFELSFWCGTCPFLFQRLHDAARRLSLEALRDRLTAGASHIDTTVVDAFSMLLPEGQYLPLLLRVAPRLVQPGDEYDYFAHEQPATWGVGDDGLPEDPATPYYRTFATHVDDEAHLYEFVVPMVAPERNDPDTVLVYGDLLSRTATPTAVAVSTLDISQPAVIPLGCSDYHAHWGLTHFLLDGHHKMQAAAATGRQLQLFALVSVEASLAQPQDIDRLPDLRRQPMHARSSADPA